ncbi:MAG TPA: hypothetical protein VHC69_04010 [Polyangiaceae bacterium]|nr:hypothetical protein [Polyangiaceae bacterium]
MKRAASCTLVVTLATVPLAAVARAEQGKSAGATAPLEQDQTALSKQTQNPVADLVSMPFQFNFTSNGGLGARTFLNLNFQPVIPIRLTPDFNLIARTIVPIDDVPIAANERSTGFGDIQEQLFFAPSGSGDLVWGIGPAASFPTATAEAVETGTWALGPTAVVLTMPGPWVIGALASQFFPIGDSGGSPKTNLFVLQYFVNFNFAAGWAISTAPTITANWDAARGHRWTVPFGGGISKTTVLAGQPLSIGVQYFRNVVRPEEAGSNTLRFALSLLFPTGSPK